MAMSDDQEVLPLIAPDTAYYQLTFKNPRWVFRREALVWGLVGLFCFVLVFLNARDDGANNQAYNYNTDSVRNNGALVTSTVKNDHRHLVFSYNDVQREMKKETLSESSSALLPPTTKTFVDVNTRETVVRTFYDSKNKDKQGFSALDGGSCWCNPMAGDDFCSCSPSVAIDVILASGPSHVWLVKRRKENKLACMGGFVETGETTEEAVARELMEETSLILNSPPRLFGVYTDPRRDLERHRHSVSVVYVVDVPVDAIPNAGDDASEIIRVHVDSFELNDYFLDHKTILMDYKRSIAGVPKSNVPANFGSLVTYDDPVKRAVCHVKNGYIPDL